MIHLYRKLRCGVGWANVGPADSFLKRTKPDFDPSTYGSTNVTGVVAGLSAIFQITKLKGKGATQRTFYRPKIATY